MEYGGALALPISPNIIRQMSLATVRNLIDALVELIANSDDSYKRLEAEGIRPNGVIQIEVCRKKGGICERIEVRDFAEGMDRPSLERAIVFAEGASGIEKGKSVRGFFGRGLKEAIIALGKGQIETIKEGMYDSAVIWSDSTKNVAQYQLLKGSVRADDEIRRRSGIVSGNGSLVRIDVLNEKIKCPDYETFKRQLTSHYALRDINSSRNRHVELVFRNWKGVTFSTKISYSDPKGRRLDGSKLSIAEFDDQIQIDVFESREELDSPKGNPFGQAGFLIKTEGAILDLQLFRYENERAACYFFGNLFCPGIAKLLRQGEQGLIDPNRAGLDWKHPYCLALRNNVERYLAPCIERKRKELEPVRTTEVPERAKKMLRTLCSLLNRLAKEELEPFNPLEVGPDIDEFMIKPESANLQLGVPRVFTVYVPNRMWNLVEQSGRIEVSSSNAKVEVSDSVIEPSELRIHPKHAELLYGRFAAVGTVVDEAAYLVCRIGEYSTQSRAVVTQPREGKRKRTLTGRTMGFFFCD